MAMAAKFKQRLGVIIAFITLLVHPIQLQDECQYKYTIQPPEQLSCNPYVNGLTLRCRVEGPLNTDFTVEWYRTSSTQTTPKQFKPAEEEKDTLPNGVAHRSRVNIVAGSSELDDTPTFWCWVRANGRLQKPSRKLMLPPESFYTGNAIDRNCTLGANGYVDEDSCADLNLSPPSLALDPSATPLPGDGNEQQSGGGGSDDESLETALFSVISVIVVFCIVIVTLAVAVVILYRKKIRRVKIKGAAAPNPYSGFSQEAGNQRSAVSSSPAPPSSRPPSRPPSFRNAPHRPSTTATAELEDVGMNTNHPYSQLGPRDFPPPLSVQPTTEYSKLGPHTDSSPPPRPPKPLLLRRTSSNPTSSSVARDITTKPRPPSATYTEPIGTHSSSPPPPPHPSHPPLPPSHHAAAIVPPVNIYQTLEDPNEGKPRTSGHFYHVLEGPSKDSKEKEESLEYDYATTNGRWPIPVAKPNGVVAPRRGQDGEGKRKGGETPGEFKGKGGAGLVTQKSLFDDPEYSPVKIPPRRGGGGKDAIEVIDPRYVGDYERHPNYEMPTVKLSARDVDPKYLGDYEWDPTYIPKPPPRRKTSAGARLQRKGSLQDRHLRAVTIGKEEDRPPKPPKRRQSLGAVDSVRLPLAKYLGDYERNPTYVPAPLRNGSTGMGKGLPPSRSSDNVGKIPVDILDLKYRGNYERNPIYMAQLIQKASKQGKHPGAGYSTGRVGSPSDDLVPPHLPHEYKCLEDALRDRPQEYATLTSDLPDTAAVNTSHQEYF